MTAVPAQTFAPLFSVVVPARDESERIGACLDATARASRACPGAVETIVVCNRCTDGTGEIARARGAQVAVENARNLSLVRNAGARLARGKILVTVDADSVMSDNMLSEIERKLRNPRCVGGGVMIRPERLSLGIALTGLLIYCSVPIGLSAGLFWCRRRDFEAVGGFDPGRRVGEDIDFARRLRAHGRRTGRRFRTLYRAFITTSCRKFDYFGDWYLLRRPWLVGAALRGGADRLADRFFYDFPR
ncbi:MAG TPA: glycosyltransferase [bacterium]|nr:glycosyltransferase [bacterium]HPJ71657.1 glycosyltransferase [bacterium]HPQ66767.1 glycosyltransferase [bacterium]